MSIVLIQTELVINYYVNMDKYIYTKIREAFL
jgi:hypothetical protein